MRLRSAFRAVTATGWYVVVLSLACATVGWAWAWVEGWFVAVIGAVLLVVALPFLFGGRAYRISIEPASGRVVAGGELLAEIEVTNTSARPQLPAVAELAVTAVSGVNSAEVRGSNTHSPDTNGTDGIFEIAVPLLGPHQSTRIPALLPAVRRGVLRLGPATLTRRDPLGLLRRELSWRERHLIHVHPRTVPLPPYSAGLIRDLEGKASPKLTDSDLSFHAVREYAPGDAVRHVHWKATAKTGALMVRQFEETQAARVAVLFDSRLDEYEDRDEFELGVSVAASLSLLAVRAGREQFVAASRSGRGTGLAELPAHNRTALLDAWSELEPAADGPRMETLSHGVAASSRALSVVAIVTGSVPGVARIRRAAVAYPPDVRVLAVRCERLGDPRVQRIDPLTLCTIGALEDLPGLMLRGSL